MALPYLSTYNKSFLMVSTADHITGSTGLTPTVTLGKAGSTTFVSSTGVIKEQANGWYTIGLTTVDLNTIGDLTIHASASGADPTDLLDQVGGNITSNIRKGLASTGFPFVMTNSVTHGPMTGLAVSATRALDGSTTFVAMTNSVVEMGNGLYHIDLSSADTLGNHLAYRFTASSADDRVLVIHTVPYGG